MTSPLFLEFIRQLLRLICVWLITMGLPPDIARLVEHPEAAALTVGLISYAVAEAGWIAAKVRELRK